jgi:hypothetical protein
MGVTYAVETDVTKLEPKELGDRLGKVMTGALEWLGGVGELEASRPEREGKWSAKQVIGHLTDSAVNNLIRMVRMQITEGLALAGYEQMEWVELQGYQERPWSDVLELWAVLNRQMAWMISRMDKAKLAGVSMVEGDALTLGYLIEDYVAHMEHHLRLMRGWLG